MISAPNHMRKRIVYSTKVGFTQRPECVIMGYANPLSSNWLACLLFSLEEVSTWTSINIRSNLGVVGVGIFPGTFRATEDFGWCKPIRQMRKNLVAWSEKVIAKKTGMFHSNNYRESPELNNNQMRHYQLHGTQLIGDVSYTESFTAKGQR